MKCQDVMLTLVFKAHPEMTVQDCARLMRDEHLGFLPVLDDARRLVGVVTDRDLTTRVLAEGRSPSIAVGAVMSAGPFLTCRAEEELEKLELRMAKAKKSRALVQAKDGSLMGVISLSDIAQREKSATKTGRLFKEVTRRESVSIIRQ